MKRLNTILFFGVITFAIFYFLPSENLRVIPIPETVGRTLGVLLFSYLITLPFERKIKIYENEKSLWTKKYSKTFGIVWLILMALSIAPSFMDIDKANSKSAQFEYAPQNNLYSVSFSGTPIIKETLFPINGNNIKSETAELSLDNGYSFQRAESCSINIDISKSYGKESLSRMLAQYAEVNGLSYPEINYEETTLGKIGTIRGYKKLSDKNKGDYNVTYFTKVYVRDTALFMVTVGSISEKYPTEKISSFLNSIRLKK